MVDEPAWRWKRRYLHAGRASSLDHVLRGEIACPCHISAREMRYRDKMLAARILFILACTVYSIACTCVYICASTGLQCLRCPPHHAHCRAQIAARNNPSDQLPTRRRDTSLADVLRRCPKLRSRKLLHASCRACPLGWLDARPTILGRYAASLSTLNADRIHIPTKLACASRVSAYVGGVTVMAAPDLGNGPYSEEWTSAFSKSGDFPCAPSPRMHGVCGQTFGLLDLRQWVSGLN
jgi:hypothetical protein